MIINDSNAKGLGYKQREQMEAEKKTREKEAKRIAKEERRLALVEAQRLKDEAKERAALLEIQGDKPPVEDSSNRH